MVAPHPGTHSFPDCGCPGDGPFPKLNPSFALLTTLNETVDLVNDIVLDKYVDGVVLILDAAHELSNDSDGNDDAIAKQHATLEYMRGCVQSGVPSSTLKSKKGCVVILVRVTSGEEATFQCVKTILFFDYVGYISDLDSSRRVWFSSIE